MLTGWVRRDKKGGWIRLWDGGPGWAWNDRHQPKIRGVRSLRIGRWRVRYLRKERDLERFVKRAS